MTLALKCGDALSHACRQGLTSHSANGVQENVALNQVFLSVMLWV